MPILDNFEYQFINDVTPTENGLMSATDKLKLNNINIRDVEFIRDGLKEMEEYNIPQFIYGIRIDPANPDPYTSVEYIDNAYNFIPLSVDQTTGVCNYGSWKDIITNEFGIKPCLIKKDGTIIAYLNPDNYNLTVDGNPIDIESGENGQVMIKFDHLYYKFSGFSGKMMFEVSNKRNDYSWQEAVFAAEDGIGTIKKNMFISAYECAQVNNSLQSISGKTNQANLFFDEVERFSQIGSFHMMNIMKKQFIIYLGYLVTKSLDLKSAIGNGNIESTEVLKTGTMNDKGLFYGKSTRNEGVKLFGIENLWGNQLEYMTGMIQKLAYDIQEDGTSIEKQYIYCKDFFPYNDIADFAKLIEITPNTSGFISGIEFITHSIHFPYWHNGSSTTYFNSYFQNGESTSATEYLYAIGSGDNTYSDKAGPEFLLLANSNIQRNITTHLVY